MTARQSLRPARTRNAGQGLGAHKSFSTFIFLITIGVIGALTWLGLQGASWAWLVIVLPVLYTAGGFLYRLESQLRLPGWMAQAIDVSATLWPPIKWFAKSDEAQFANEVLVDAFNRTLHEYGLVLLSEARSEELTKRALPLGVRALASEWRQEQLRDRPDDADAVPSIDAVELLHRERCGESTFNLWQAREGGLVDELAPLVRHSERMPRPYALHPFGDADVRALLDALRDFDVELLADELRVVNRLGGRLQRYMSFLCAGRKKHGDRIGEVTSLIAGKLPAGSSTMFRLDGAAETLKLMGAIEECDDRSLGAVHRGIFLAEHDIDPGALRERACADALQRPGDGRTDPIGILQAYLWEKDRRGAGPIDRDELDSKWAKWSSEAERALDAGMAGAFEADLKELAERLHAGIWPIQRIKPGSREQGDREPEPGERYPPPLPIAVPDHEEVRDLDAYLITFDDKVGRIAQIVDGLKSHGSIYRFGPYTSHTRLGIVPKGMPFHEFVEQFFTDLDIALRKHFPRSDDLPTRLDQLEITVNRVDLAHCRELWFGDSDLGPVMRSPSIYNVLETIEPSLEQEERPPVEAAFERVAGGP